ncbi:MAG: succinylglutamate desuccinylase/aspartoacylase family protein [Deltaproteobacteria bacterium]|jgi:hypothetical protein|nr:succinylglutamate desuccinylase/aspartoacylase family protein [Deltaproteobacteria bacterium]
MITQLSRHCPHAVPIFFIFILVWLGANPVLSATLTADEKLPHFTLHRSDSGEGPTLLVIGGIQGDEPGGFSAASLLVTHYQINKGNVWVVPNLNFPSIVHSSRGLHGDMNRKFATLSRQDPEYQTIQHIQELIQTPQVDLVINMHDGSGFYRPRRESAMRNPDRWGQCIVIDQEVIDLDVLDPNIIDPNIPEQDTLQNLRFKNLHNLAEKVAAKVNTQVLQELHGYRIKNTHTKNYDREMEKSLSYFAVTKGKAAFGIEASKEISPGLRAFYHICLLEAFMQEMGIDFTRKFHLSVQGILTALNKDVTIRLFDNRTVLTLDNARLATLGYIPVLNSTDLKTVPSNPLLAVLPGKKQWRVIYGNRTLTAFTPVYVDFDDALQGVDLIVDGQPMKAYFGDIVQVTKAFMVKSQSGYRVNAIGAQQEKDGSESGVLLARKHFATRFSMDKAGYVYRIEVYKDQAFCGMVLVNFGPESQPVLSNIPMTAVQK